MPVPQIVIDQAKAIIDANLAVIKEILKDQPVEYADVIMHLAKEIGGNEPYGQFGYELYFSSNSLGSLYKFNKSFKEAIDELAYMLSSKASSFRELYQLAKDNGYGYNGGQLKDDVGASLGDYLLTQSELVNSEAVTAQIAGLHIETTE